MAERKIDPVFNIHEIYNRVNIVNPYRFGGGGGSYAYLLDDNPGALYAHSFRLLSSTYAGSCIRVRRSSDNLEQDIGFVDNYLDKAALLNFAGAGNAYLVKRYDQTSNSNDFFQTDGTLQLSIVNSGVVAETRGFVCLSHEINTNKGLRMNIAFTTYNEYIVGIHPNDGGSVITSTGQPGSYYSFIGFQGSTTTVLHANFGSPTLRTNGVDRSPATRGDVYNLLATGAKNLIIHRDANISAWTLLKTTYPTTSYTGLRQEFERIAYPNSTNEAGAENNLNSYYTIY